MGIKIVDRYTIEHFCFGIIFQISLKNLSINYNFLISNGVHLLIELLENNINPYTGEKLESKKNHISDIIFFFFGWLVSMLFIKNTSKYFHIICIISTILTILKETLREIYPLSDSVFFKGAFIKNLK